MSVALRIIVLLISFACVAGGALFISCTFSRVRLDPKKYNDDAVILAAFGDKKETIRSYSVFYYTQFHIFPGDILASIGHPSYEHQTFFVGKHKRMMRAVQAMGVLGLFFAFWGMVLAAVYTVVGCMGGGGGSSDESAPRTPYGDDHDTTTAPTEDMSEVEVDPSNPPPQREQNDEEEPKEDLDTQEEKKKDKKQKKSGGAAPACTALAIVMLLLFILAFIMYIPAFVMMVILIEKPGKTALQSYTWADYGFALVSPTLGGARGDEAELLRGLHHDDCRDGVGAGAHYFKSRPRLLLQERWW
ncbi:hypothetical protein ADEAN_000698400 [Angomonas deanei]|uniref:Uncharacterized protein n=1 Tax=Angomonas deanei TaxID=59799 RepID=A0A7G2CK74_9TRYP|nr:hypothetical protein ADEAN_000698400 [Angomonas deanei]